MKTATITESTRKSVQSFYKALAEGNIEAITNHFSEETDWYIPGEQSLAPWLGERKSRQAIKDFFQLLWQNAEPISAQIDPIVAEGNIAYASGSFASRMLRTGKIYESIFFARFVVENEMIVHYRFLEDSNGLVKALT